MSSVSCERENSMQNLKPYSVKRKGELPRRREVCPFSEEIGDWRCTLGGETG